MLEFSQAVIENLGHYVYLLEDPRSSKVFYVGKGSGNRVFEHLATACLNDTETAKADKNETIREIIAAGLEPKTSILRHGLEEDTAFELEASLIDFLGIDDLTNLQGGHHS